MDETSFKILETLSREIGTEMSISQLTERIGESYGKAYYANIYNKLQQLARDNIVTISKVGNTSIARINFDDYWIMDILAQVEMQRKRIFLKDTANASTAILFSDIEKTFLTDLPFVRSISVIRPEKNQMTNRTELLILVKGYGMDFFPEQEDAKAVHRAIKSIQMMHPQQIDYLILNEAKFLDQITSDELNPVQEMLADKITFYGPQNFWHAIQVIAEKGIPIKIAKSETSPHKISEQDLVYNMAKFGYNEMGTRLTKEREMCIEYTVAAMMAQGDARRIEAVPVLLAKNTVNYDMLIFLARKFKLIGKLMGLIQALSDIIPEKKDLQYAIKVMKEMRIEAEPADRASIMEKMRLYNAA
ncbi:hypothetical protein [Nitrososphaera sp.]|uniref:hypothetical protein n=1 Tax=Nitrososphaera sp. TaxID=1971748 RepID=UPI00307DAC06